MREKNSLDVGWFVAAEDQQAGPFSASEAWQLVTGIDAVSSVRVWHPFLPGWQPLSAASIADLAAALPADHAATLPADLTTAAPAALTPAVPSPKLNLSNFRLSNARYLAWIACSGLPFIVLGAALAREFQDVSVSVLVLAIVGYLGWWLYLEQAGLRLLEADIVFPQRIPFWPFPALYLQRIRVSDIQGFECWSRGTQLHLFRLHTAGRQNLIVLDDALHREILISALEQRVPQA